MDGAKAVALNQSGSSVVNPDIDLVAVDTDHDLAILRMLKQSCYPLPLGDSSVLQPGQRILALGNPLANRNLTASLTDGLISGVRNLSTDGQVIQISAPLSHGNSGGPVMDESGKVVGIVAFKLSEGELLNFAVPVNELRSLAGKANGVVYSWRQSSTSAYESDAYKLPDQAATILANAERAAGTCELKDAMWTETVWNPEKNVRWQSELIERASFGSVQSMQAKTNSGQIVHVIRGESLNGRWTEVEGKTTKKPLAPDDIVNHLVDNWYAFCPGIVSLWRNVTVTYVSLEGKTAYLLKVEEPFFGSTIRFWFDKDEYQLIGREYVNRSSAGVAVIRDVYSNFQKIDGFTIPLEEKKIANGSVVYIKTSQFRANVGFPDYLFEPKE